MTLTTVQPFLVDSLVALFDDDLPPPRLGDPLPPYWHLAACAAPMPSRQLGSDGHPTAGILTPPPDLPRRMFAGGRLTISHHLRVGEAVEQLDRITGTTDKTGRSGRLRFVTVESEFRRADGVTAMVEQRDIVYREATSRTSVVNPREPSPTSRLICFDSEPLRAELQADPVALQRFSALTSNAHRIHYDHPYATSVEGYPDLLVHGPLLLLSLLELTRRHCDDRSVSRISFTAMAPIFVNDSVLLAGVEAANGSIELNAIAHNTTAMTAHVEFS